MIERWLRLFLSSLKKYNKQHLLDQDVASVPGEDTVVRAKFTVLLKSHISVVLNMFDMYLQHLESLLELHIKPNMIYAFW